MDTRLYSMRQLVRALDQTKNPDAAAAQMESYRAVLSDWNGQLNETLSLVEWHFGTEERRYFESDLQGGFRAVGSRLEDAYKAYVSQRPISRVGEHSRLRAEIDELNAKIYLIVGRMLAAIREGRTAAFHRAGVASL
jgi:hypothetical protein